MASNDTGVKRKAGSSRWTTWRKRKNASRAHVSKVMDTLHAEQNDEHQNENSEIRPHLIKTRYPSDQEDSDDQVPEDGASLQVSYVPSARPVETERIRNEDENIDTVDLITENPEAIWENLLEEENWTSIFLSDDEDFDEPSCDVEVFDLNAYSKRYLPREKCAPLLAIAFYLKHQLSDSALQHYLNINRVTHTALDQSEMASPHMLLKKYQHLRASVKKVFLCVICSKPLVTSSDGKPLKEQPCNHKYDPKKHDGSFLLFLPVLEQLYFFLENYGMRERDTSETYNYRGDVHTGRLFRKYMKQGFIDDKTLTLQLNTDGAKIFKSSKYGFWPFMGLINEAEYSIRRSNVVLFALWYGNRKPPMDAFFETPLKELERLRTEGFQFKESTYKLLPVIITLDSVARPIMRNTTQHNGECGCDFCLHPGIVVKVGRGHARDYPEPREGQQKYPKRTLHQHIEDVQHFLDWGVHRHGVMGDSPFLHLRGFNFIRAFIPDYMHGVCLGVIRYFLLLWTEPRYSKQTWSIRKKISVINQRLSAAKPPYEITRSPRTLDNIKFWKASEFKTFGLYYFPILEGVLPEPYYNHFQLLSYSLYVLLQDKVHCDDISDTRRMLSEFASQTEVLYGQEHVKFNVHLLTHLSDSVDDWGSLWATSTFIPEHFNGMLSKLCNGTQATADQMAHNLLLKKAIVSEVVDLMEQDKLLPEIRSLFTELLDIPRSVKKQFCELPGIALKTGASLLGRGTKKSLDTEDQDAIKLLFGLNESTMSVPVPESGDCFMRFRTPNGSIFTTKSYARATKRSNHCAFLQDGRFFLLEDFLHVPDPFLQDEVIMLGYLLEEVQGERNIYSSHPTISNSRNPKGLTARLCQDPELRRIACFSRDIQRKSVMTSVNPLTNIYTLTALVNEKETD